MRKGGRGARFFEDITAAAAGGGGTAAFVCTMWAPRSLARSRVAVAAAAALADEVEDERSASAVHSLVAPRMPPPRCKTIVSEVAWSAFSSSTEVH